MDYVALLAKLDDKACGGHPDHFTPDPVFRTSADAIRLLQMEIERLRTYVDLLEPTLKHATECCVAFQSGGQFNHLMRLGEPIFNGVPRLVAKLSN